MLMTYKPDLIILGLQSDSARDMNIRKYAFRDFNVGEGGSKYNSWF